MFRILDYFLAKINYTIDKIRQLSLQKYFGSYEVKARLYPKWHAPEWDVGLLGGSQSKISKSLLKKWSGTSPYPTTKWRIFYYVPLYFSSKDFEILDLDPPNNPTSHYGACHFGYNLPLKQLKEIR